MGSRYIITGAAGFIGSTLAETLLDRGHRVTGIDCFVDYYPRRIKEDNLSSARGREGFEFLEQDILTADWDALLRDAAGVFHLAAQAGVRASWGESFRIYTDNNVLATQTVLEAIKGRGIPLVYASSSSVYGDTETLPMTEDLTPHPYSPYGVTKLAAEHLCLLYTRNFGVPTCSMRFFTVYGPRQRPDMAFHRFIKSALKGEPVTLFDDGGQTRDFTFVGDIVEGCIRAVEAGRPGGVYNLGGGNRISMNDVLTRMETVLGRPIEIRRGERQKGDMRHTYADTSRAAADLGFAPKVSLDEGLALEAAWIEERMALLV